MLLSPEETRERLKHRDVILATAAVLATKSGQDLFKYLFEEFEVGCQPPLGSEGHWLYDKIGFLRAGSAFFDLAAEANAGVAGALLAQVKKEQYEAAQLQQRLEDEREGRG